ncbi:MAG: GGDEF domain-containing protein [Pseudomonadota bacterium]
MRPSSQDPFEPHGGMPLRRHLSAWITRLGALRATMLVTLAGALGSLGLTWLLVHGMGHSEMGDALWISLLVPIPLGILFGGTTILLVIALESARQQVQEMALADALTGLGNRRRFVPAARREVDLARRHGQPLALLMMDIDHFKRINDTYGHQVGDLALQEIGRRCTHALRHTDLLARWGGEEFVMLLPNTGAEQALLLAERVRQAVSATPLLLATQKEPIPMTVSIGVVGVPVGRFATLDALIQFADRALYSAKSDGRDKVTVSDPPPQRHDSEDRREDARTPV